MSQHEITVTINGEKQTRTVEARLLLVHFIRETLGLTGTHVGCDTTSCGACTINFDGEAVKSCTVFAVQLELAGAAIKQVRIGLTNVSPIPMRARNAEAALTGKQPSDDVLEAAGKAAAAECDPSADLRGQVDYKRDLVRVLTKRAVRRAIERAQGGRP